MSRQRLTRMATRKSVESGKPYERVLADEVALLVVFHMFLYADRVAFAERLSTSAAKSTS